MPISFPRPLSLLIVEWTETFKMTLASGLTLGPLLAADYYPRFPALRAAVTDFRRSFQVFTGEIQFVWCICDGTARFSSSCCLKQFGCFCAIWLACKICLACFRGVFFRTTRLVAHAVHSDATHCPCACNGDVTARAAPALILHQRAITLLRRGALLRCRRRSTHI